MLLTKRSRAKLQIKQKPLTQSQAKKVPNKGPRPRKNKKSQAPQNQMIISKRIYIFSGPRVRMPLSPYRRILKEEKNIIKLIK